MTTPLSELRQASWRPDQCSMCGSLNYSPFYKDGRPYDPWIKGAPLWDVCKCDECGHKWDFTFIHVVERKSA